MKISFPPCLLPIPALMFLLFNGCVTADHLLFFASHKPYNNLPDLYDSVEQPPPPIPQQLPAPEPEETIYFNYLELTVEQAITLAMSNNRNLKTQRLNPEIIKTVESIERGVYDPELFGELEFSQAESAESAGNGSRLTVKEENRNTLLGLRQKLPTGTTIEASFAQESSEMSNTPQEQSSRIGLTLSQSLLRGFGPTVNLVSLRQAQLETAVSNSELRGITESLLAETETSYWDYVLAGEKIDIFESSLAVARQQLDEIEQRIEVGTLPRIEAAAAHAEVARHEQALIDVRSTLEEKQLRLLRLLNPRSKRPFDLQIRATSSAEINPNPITDLDDRLQLAEQSRPDLREARLRLKQNRLEIIMTKNGLLPRLDLFINLGKTGYADSFSGSFKDLDESNHDMSAGIMISHYLNNRQAKAQDRAARVSRHQAEDSVENLKQLVELDVRLAVNEFERTRKQITATRATRLLQDETLKAEKERFDVGVSTALLVAQAQRDLLLSTINEAEAIINCRKSLIRLYLAEGSLLERRGIRLARDLSFQKGNYSPAVNSKKSLSWR